MRAEIIAIGTEILLGDILNTNAQFLSKELASLGIDVYNQTVIGDNEERILEAFKRAFEKCDLIITTGGLGPTQDDLTKEIGARFFNKDLKLDNDSLEWIKSYLNIKEGEALESNRKQAYMPVDSIILKNPNGTAPGAILSENDKILIVMPGPPNEVIPMFEDYVKEYLLEKTGSTIRSKTLRLFGIGESIMATKIDSLIKNSTNPTVAPYAKDSDVILRLTAKGKDEEECVNLINPIIEEIKETLGNYIYAEEEKDSMQSVVAKLLCDKKLTISTAESCTGGLVASSLIEYPGISDVFMEGVVTYSNEAKMRRLGVKKETLDKYGAVSKEIAEEMAIGIAKEVKTNIGISTTGIAGPGGGTLEKPVGLVYIGIYINGKTKVEKLELSGTRDKIRKRAALNALNILRKEILAIK
ncbi:competence/damage-inducible protein A [Clostridium sp.]|uniref:competence/damage-inducible protein A n=1 Tax=Clostridium sp. TaxID=1506 RepID=UPI0026348653|nr:competence/damage-inducible protein A [Clostridium sp.]